MRAPEQNDFREKRTFLGRFGFALGLLVVVGVGVGLFRTMFSHSSSPAPRKAQEMVMIKPLPPPPPPPPPPPTPPQNEPREQMMEQQPVDEAEAKPEAAPDASPSIGTNITGNGPADGFGLGKNGNGMVGGGGGGKSGSRFGWYANQVVKSISTALGQNPRTRNASFDIKAKIWADVGGRITRARLVEPTGDAELDAAIKNGVLTGHQLQEPPPDGMPMPIVMHLTARRPN